MKKTLSFVLIMILCISLVCAPAGAAADKHVYDDAGTLSAEETAELETLLVSASAENELDYIILTVDSTDGEEIEQFADNWYDSHGCGIGDEKDGLIFVIDFGGSQFYITAYGSVPEYISGEQISTIGDEINDELNNGEYLAAYKHYVSLTDSVFRGETIGAAPADVLAGTPEATGRLVDAAGLLTESEASSLKSKLDEISTRLQFDVVIVTVESTGGKSPMAYADDYYDYNGYGFTDAHDGTLLLLAMDERDWCISTTGYGITAINDAAIDFIGDKMVSHLSDGEYYEGFETFADLVDKRVTEEKDGKGFKKPFEFGIAILISLGVGLLLSLIFTFSAKGKLKSVRRHPFAGDYVKQGSMQLTDSRDIFLYTHVTKTARPKDSGGSSTHSGSSGTSHGGGGGKF